MTDHIFTFGYEGLSLKAFIARLKSARVETVIDVRANPLSRKPGFSKRAPSPRLCESAGIDYDHRPAVGCPNAHPDPLQGAIAERQARRKRASREWRMAANSFDYSRFRSG